MFMTKRESYLQKYYFKNRERIKEKRIEYIKKNKDKIKARMALYRLKNKDKIAEKNHKRYLKEKDHILTTTKIWQKKNREKAYKKQKEWLINNRERYLIRSRIASKKWRERNIEKVKKARYDTRDRLRTDVLNAYGHKCQCCGITTKEFLAIDHINGGGAAHRRTLAKKASAQTMYTWLRKNNYPVGFQILCHNCNAAKSYYGGCPHAK